MMTGAPVEKTEKAGFHFPGYGEFRNAFIWAKDIEQATEIWLKTRVKLDNGTTAAPLSTPASTPKEKGVE